MNKCKQPTWKMNNKVYLVFSSIKRRKLHSMLNIQSFYKVPPPHITFYGIK